MLLGLPSFNESNSLRARRKRVDQPADKGPPEFARTSMPSQSVMEGSEVISNPHLTASAFAAYAVPRPHTEASYTRRSVDGKCGFSPTERRGYCMKTSALRL